MSGIGSDDHSPANAVEELDILVHVNCRQASGLKKNNQNGNSLLAKIDQVSGPLQPAPSDSNL